MSLQMSPPIFKAQTWRSGEFGVSFGLGRDTILRCNHWSVKLFLRKVCEWHARHNVPAGSTRLLRTEKTEGVFW